MSSPNGHQIKYDVFLSFRGIDTRNNIISHLYAALHRQGIMTFIDNRIERGEEIDPAILKAIEESAISVIIISKNYASSPWCLDELLKILECKEERGQKVLPVFYHVDPTHVQEQTGSFKAAFAKHDKSVRESLGKVESWRNGLCKAASISGLVWTNTRPESALVEEIIKDILKKIRHLSSYHFKDLVGIKSRVQHIESLLRIGLDDVRVIGIWGMGGIGKTTLAKVIFNKFSFQFEGTCFLENVRDESLKRGLVQLRDELFVKILSEGNVNAKMPFVMSQLCRKKVLIVLDDVDDYEQIEFLARGNDWFGAGTRIIITSRDKKVFQDRVHGRFEVQALADREALQLFSLFAFKRHHPQRDHMELSNKVVTYAKGIPLALKVLGLFLHDKSKQEWKSALHKLGRAPDMKIQNVLRISYDGLDFYEQQIFLDIACFFRGQHISHVEEVLDACGFSTLISLRVLADKSLITMSNNKIEMHDLLQQMGREIVRQESIKEPGKRSRLWDHKDICHVLLKNTGTEDVEGISLDLSKVRRLGLAYRAFANMNRIKLLKVYHGCFNGLFPEGLESLSQKVQCPQGLESLPDELRYLKWHFYPLNSLPSNFHPEKLVELDMSGSKVVRLWTGVLNLANIKVIRLRHCKHLIEMPNLSRAPNLKTMDFGGCKSLLEISPSIRYLSNLSDLILEHCKVIRCVPNIKHLRSLKSLSVYGCSNLSKFPQVSRNMEYLDLAGTDIDEVPSSIGSLSQLEELNLRDCTRLRNLPSEIFRLKSLRSLIISGPYVNLLDIERNLHCLSSLRHLTLSGDNIVSIPESIKQLSWLQELDLTLCTSLESLPELPPSLQCFKANDCLSLKAVSNSMISFTEDWDKFPYHHKEEFFFINCLCFDLSAYRNILRHAQQRILLLAHAAAELHEGLDRSEECHRKKEILDSIRKKFTIVFPKDEIPKWITHHRTGYSVKVLLPPNWCSNFLGFALCVALEFEDSSEMDPDLMWIRWECKFKSRYGESNWVSTRFKCEPCTYIDLLAEHIFLSYDSNFHLTINDNGESKYNYKEVLFEVYPEDSCNRPLPSFKVKKSGVRLLYDGDKAESSKTVSFAKKEKEPHLERLNISSNYSEHPHYPSNNLASSSDDDDLSLSISSDDDLSLTLMRKRKIKDIPPYPANLSSLSCDGCFPCNNLYLPLMRKKRKILKNSHNPTNPSSVSDGCFPYGKLYLPLMRGNKKIQNPHHPA